MCNWIDILISTKVIATYSYRGRKNLQFKVGCIEEKKVYFKTYLNKLKITRLILRSR